MAVYHHQIVFCTCLLMLTVGCGRSGPVRVVVEGTVTLNGVPVEDGQIRFVPDEQTVGPVTISPIRQGQYLCGHKGGVPIGTHRVEVLAWDPTVPIQKGPGGPPRPQWVPLKYNEESELELKVEDSSAPIIKNWELEGPQPTLFSKQER